MSGICMGHIPRWPCAWPWHSESYGAWPPFEIKIWNLTPNICLKYWPPFEIKIHQFRIRFEILAPIWNWDTCSEINPEHFLKHWPPFEIKILKYWPPFEIKIHVMKSTPLFEIKIHNDDVMKYWPPFEVKIHVEVIRLTPNIFRHTDWPPIEIKIHFMKWNQPNHGTVHSTRFMSIWT